MKMFCHNCGNKQNNGRFCQKCGTELEISNQESQGELDHTVEVAATDASETQQEANQHVENLKKQSKLYGSYFLANLKKPALTHSRSDASLIHPLISIGLLALIISIATYIPYAAFNYFYDVNFVSYVIKAFFFMLVIIGIASLSLFVINHFFGPKLNYKAIISVYGAHLSPSIIAAIVTLLLLFLKSYQFGLTLLSLTVIFSFFILPLYLISGLLAEKSVKIPPFYGFMLYVAMSSFLFYIFGRILADSILGGLFENLFMNSMF